MGSLGKSPSPRATPTIQVPDASPSSSKVNKDSEVIVVWRVLSRSSSLLQKGLAEEISKRTLEVDRDELSSQNVVLGLFGFNHKPSKSSQSSGAEIFPVCLSLAALQELREAWLGLGKAAEQYMSDHVSSGPITGQQIAGRQVTGRPISRSVTRQRKHREKTQKQQAEFQVSLDYMQCSPGMGTSIYLHVHVLKAGQFIVM